ncbi:hypothetical protein SAMN02910369_00709 [Lachnospiraceae bacterium NE2001]|nr:hypothetical protein SAMN02910369_00709 [Lachnospiraceae bacterium NE2001]
MKEVESDVNEINQPSEVFTEQSFLQHTVVSGIAGAIDNYSASLDKDTKKYKKYVESDDFKLLKGLDEYNEDGGLYDNAYVNSKYNGTQFYNGNSNPGFALDVRDENLVEVFRGKVRKIADRMEADINQSYGNDELDIKMKSYLKSTSSDMLKRTMDGYSDTALTYRNPLAMGFISISACVVNDNSNNKLKNNIKNWQYKFPVYDFVIEANELNKTLASYYKEKDQNKGVLSPEKEEDYRQKIYDSVVSTMTYYNRTMAATENVKTNEDLKKDLVIDKLNDAFHLHPLSARGTNSFNAALETYKAGLENGWPMEDLASVAAFATMAQFLKADTICNRAMDIGKFQMNDAPQYQSEDHKKYVESMVQMFEDFKTKPLTSAEERKKFLDDMNKKVQEGVKKKYIRSATNQSKSGTFDYYFNQTVANRNKYEKFIEQGKEPAVHKKVQVGPERRLSRLYADLTSKRTDLRFSSENKEHKNLRLAVDDLRKFYRENPAPGLQATKAEIAKYNMRYMTKLEQVSYYSDQYKKTHKNPSSTGGQARLKGAVEFGDFAESEMFEIKKQLNANKLATPTNEKNRNEMRKSLEEMLKGLNARHTGTLHREALDSDEMTKLKDKTKEAIEYLKVNRGVNLFEDEKFGKIMKDLSKCSNNYTKAKKDVAREKFRKNLVDESLPKGSLERNEQENEVNKQMKNWHPKTKMGRARFTAASNITKFCNKFETDKRSYNYELEGHTAVSTEQIEEEAGRPYEAGVEEILNYYKKYPSVIPEHFKKNLVTDESFKASCTPVECDGISEEDFSIVAYAAVMNTDNIPDESINKKSETKSPEVTKKDRVAQLRTMYTTDIGAGEKARENCINHYGEDFIKPVRLKAKEVLEQYKAGNKEPLINTLAEGISESCYECMHIGHMFGDRRNTYTMSVGLVEKLLDYTKKEPGLYDAVMDKLSPEAKQNLQDTLNMKEYLDKCIDSEKKLENAVKNNITLSEAEKRECIQNIVTYDFLAANHDKFRDEQVENDKTAQDFKKNYTDITMKIISGEIKDMTTDDMIKIDTKYEKAAYKPIAQVHGRLRTEEGRKKLDETVKPLVDAIPANVPEKDVLKAARGFGESFKTELAREKVERAEALRQQFKQKQFGKAKPKVAAPT